MLWIWVTTVLILLVMEVQGKGKWYWATALFLLVIGACLAGAGDPNLGAFFIGGCVGMFISEAFLWILPLREGG